MQRKDLILANSVKVRIIQVGFLHLAGREQSMKPMIGKSIDQSMAIDAN